MPNVTVRNPSTVTVRVGSTNQPRVQSTASFIGAADAQAEINQAMQLAQFAADTANTSYTLANNALPLTGGTVTGNLTVLGAFAANAEVYMVLDGGSFS